jgi:glycosyltransferase involved in cell wall biosynthesis
MGHILFISDSWGNQNLNGVSVYLSNIRSRLEEKGFKVTIIGPDQFINFPLPTYPNIKMAVVTKRRLTSLIKEIQPDYIHIATEGSLGFVARMVCVKNKWQFTTFYHTRLPEYASVRFKVLGKPASKYIKWFHRASSCVMASTDSLKTELEGKGFKNVSISPLGVDLSLFQKNVSTKLPDGLSRPLFLFMGRVAPEKNIDDFLTCDLPGSKVIIGDGPSRAGLEEKYPGRAMFVGQKVGEELVSFLSSADVFVFPSRTDTFSLAIIESLACGLPVAAYNVQGPKNILTNGYDGFIGDDLATCALNCLHINREHCVETAKRYSWDNAVTAFLGNIQDKRIVYQPEKSIRHILEAAFIIASLAFLLLLNGLWLNVFTISEAKAAGTRWKNHFTADIKSSFHELTQDSDDR